MQASYPAVYRDHLGDEQTVIENDGQALRMIVRGVEFISPSFGSFDSLTAKTPEEALQAGFTLDRYNDLVAATITYDMPFVVMVRHEQVSATLTVQIDLEGVGLNASERQWADVSMILSVGDKRYVSSGGLGCFELGLLQIQQQLPADAHLHCCFGCAFSGYNPYGDGLWGMFCHRNHKKEYIQASSKSEWFKLNETAAEYVQEIYLCSEFQQWDGKTGYRDGLHVNRLSVTESHIKGADKPVADLSIVADETKKI